MTKIINENGSYKIEFAKDSFGPYEQKFGREDCYYDDKIGDRGSVLFPYKNKEFDNTEIFLETDDVIVCTGDRTNLSGKEKAFVDIINLKTEKKQRLYTDEVNLIYNGEKEIVLNANFNGVWKTVKLDQETMEIKEEKEEKLLAFFKVLYNEKEKKWYRLDWDGNTFFFKSLNINMIEFYTFNRDNFFLKLNNYSIGDHHLIKFNDFKYIDIFELSGGNFSFNNLTFINNQSYYVSEKLRKKVLYYYHQIFIGLFLFLCLSLGPIISIIVVFIKNKGTEYYYTSYIFLLLMLTASLVFGIIIFKAYFYLFFKDYNYANVYRKKIKKSFNINDYGVVRNKLDISSKNQKIMIK